MCYGIKTKLSEISPLGPAFRVGIAKDNDGEGGKNLACWTTFGWKPQADLANADIGFVHVGRDRFIVPESDAAKRVIEVLWNNRNES